MLEHVKAWNARLLERLSELVEDGLVPAIERTYPLSDMSPAMRHLEAGHVRGKVVITP